MPRTVRLICAVRGSRNVSVSPNALATMIDFSSGVRYRWCGSLPVGMRAVSVQVTGSITLTLASREFSTNSGGAAASAPPIEIHSPPKTAHARAIEKIFTEPLSTQPRSVAVHLPIPWGRTRNILDVERISTSKRAPHSTGNHWGSSWIRQVSAFAATLSSSSDLFRGVTVASLSQIAHPESPRFLRRLNTLRGLSHEEDEQVLARGA